jgi:dATP pyrophosphohydrolase
MPKPFKIPQSVLVVIYTPAWDVLLIRRTEADPDAPAFWQSVTGSKDALDEPWAETAAREVLEETGLDCTPDGALAPGLQDWGLENIYSI